MIRRAKYTLRLVGIFSSNVFILIEIYYQLSSMIIILISSIYYLEIEPI